MAYFCMVRIYLMLEQYFNSIPIDQEYSQHKIGNQLDTYFNSFPDLRGKKLAIWGTEGVDSSKSAANAIRYELYQLIADSKLDTQCADLGNILEGSTPKETNDTIYKVASALLNKEIVSIFLGSDADQVESFYRAFQVRQESIEVALISNTLPIREYELLHRMCTSEPNYLHQVNVLAFQAPYIPTMAFDLLENLNFAHLRLGALKTKIDEAEIYVRNTSLTVFDLHAIKHADAPATKVTVPCGLSGEEACQIARYNGLSDYSKCFAIVGLAPEKDTTHTTAALAAQMLWYYLDGFFNRIQDTPSMHNEFVKYRCDYSNDDAPILFLKSKKTSRWWMHIEHPAHPENNEKHILQPCSYEDYLEAANGGTPERYLDALKRLH